MKIVIRKKRFLSWDKRMVSEIRNLSERGGTFRLWYREYPEDLTTFVAFRGKKIVGICTVMSYNGINHAGVYVHHGERRKGIGGLLLRRCVKDYEIEISPSDRQSQEFFGSFKSNRMFPWT